MNFVINGYDFTDAGALDRRIAVREEHMANIMTLKAAGKVIFAAAKINEAGDMCGSTVYMTVDSEKEVQDYLDKEVYISGKVWETVKVEVCKIPALFV